MYSKTHTIAPFKESFSGEHASVPLANDEYIIKYIFINAHIFEEFLGKHAPIPLVSAQQYHIYYPT